MHGLFRVTLLLLALVSVTWADGKMYWKEDAKQVGLPRQRAIILHHDEMETLIVQSEIAVTTGENPASIAWVVPVPSVPDIASPKPDLLDSARECEFTLFRMLTGMSHTQIHKVRSILVNLHGILGAAFCLTYLVLLPYCRARGYPLFPERWERVAKYYCMIYPILLLVSTGFTSFGKPELSEDIAILQSGRVGVHDVTVVRSDKPDALLGWLKDGQYGVGDADRAVIASYVARGWCFVAVRIDTSTINGTGMPPALVLRFPAKEAVYPMALTGTSGHATEVLLHVLADCPVNAGGKIFRRYSGDANYSAGFGPIMLHLGNYMGSLEPDGIFQETFGQWKPSHLTTFKETLTPDRMREDIVLKPAPDAKPFRATKWKW